MTADLFVALAGGTAVAVLGGYLVIHAMRAVQSRIARRREREFWKQPVTRDDFDVLRGLVNAHELSIGATSTAASEWTEWGNRMVERQNQSRDQLHAVWQEIYDIRRVLGGDRWAEVRDEALREGVCWSDTLDSLVAGADEAREGLGRKVGREDPLSGSAGWATNWLLMGYEEAKKMDLGSAGGVIGGPGAV